MYIYIREAGCRDFSLLISMMSYVSHIPLYSKTEFKEGGEDELCVQKIFFTSYNGQVVKGVAEVAKLEGPNS